MGSGKPGRDPLPAPGCSPTKWDGRGWGNLQSSFSAAVGSVAVERTASRFEPMLVWDGRWRRLTSRSRADLESPPHYSGVCGRRTNERCDPRTWRAASPSHCLRWPPGARSGARSRRCSELGNWRWRGQGVSSQNLPWNWVNSRLGVVNYNFGSSQSSWPCMVSVPVPRSSAPTSTVCNIPPHRLWRSVSSPPSVHLVAAIIDVQLDYAVLFCCRL